METTKTTAAVLLGVGIGALVGVLFAPAKGSKTRQRIMDKGNECANDFKDKINDLYQDATEKYDAFLEEVIPKEELK